MSQNIRYHLLFKLLWLNLFNRKRKILYRVCQIDVLFYQWLRHWMSNIPNNILCSDPIFVLFKLTVALLKVVFSPGYSNLIIHATISWVCDWKKKVLKRLSIFPIHLEKKINQRNMIYIIFWHHISIRRNFFLLNFFEEKKFNYFTFYIFESQVLAKH